MARTHHETLIQLQGAALALERIRELADAEHRPRGFDAATGSGPAILAWCGRVLEEIGTAEELRAEAASLHYCETCEGGELRPEDGSQEAIMTPKWSGPFPKPQKRKKAKPRGLPSINEARAAKRRARDFGTKRDWIIEFDCATCGAPGPSQPSHVKTRGAMGCAAYLIPQCDACHRFLHQKGRYTFQRRFRCNLLALASSFHERWISAKQREREISAKSARGQP